MSKLLLYILIQCLVCQCVCKFIWVYKNPGVFHYTWRATQISFRDILFSRVKNMTHAEVTFSRKLDDGSASMMMTSSNGNIFRVTGHLCGEFTGSGEFPTQRPVTRSFDVFFDLRLNKRLGKQP